MKTVTVEVQPDHLAKLTKPGKSAVAISELIWNGLDADAMHISVSFVHRGFDLIDEIRIVDNGHGIHDREAETAFGSLGGSWKRLQDRTRDLKRLLHGKEGQGRFRAFGLGEHVEWTSRYEHEGSIWQFQIIGTASDPRNFTITEPIPASVGTQPGTEVSISGIYDDIANLSSVEFIDDLTEVFAIYLSQYPDVVVEYEGTRLDPEALKDFAATYRVASFEADGQQIPEGELTVIEWNGRQKRSMYLCDPDGFTFGKTPVGIQAPGFSFTAYLRSEYIRQLAKQEMLALADLNPALTALIDRARGELREHFRRRLADRAKTLVADWKKDQVYPYTGEPTSEVEKAERQVFDVLAYSVNCYLPHFADSARSTKLLSFRLLRQALETNPGSLNKILQEVLRLPTEAQEEFATLLERTSLSQLIQAAKQIGDRLDFLRGLELLVFRPASKAQLLERTQLHRILAKETWIFGEEFNISVDDQSLTEVLQKHLERLRRESPETTADNIPEEELAPVLRGDGSEGIVDLMLSRLIPQPNRERREHLVVELKRPSQSVNPAVVQQIKSYAYAIERDERFRSTDTRWTFVAISNRVTEEAAWDMKDASVGLLHETDRLKIYLREWGSMLEACRARLSVFQEHLQYGCTDETALDYLRRTHQKYLPDVYRDPSGRQADAAD